MIRKMLSPKTDCVRIIFELPACVWADRIFSVGAVTVKRSTVTPFAQSRNGVWQAVFDLLAGREYQFRYLVDGRWQTDFHADGWAVNEFGSQNSIVDATLPSDTFPAIGGSSLLHEGLSESRYIRSQPTTIRPTPPRQSDQTNRFFPQRRQAAE